MLNLKTFSKLLIMNTPQNICQYCGKSSKDFSQGKLFWSMSEDMKVFKLTVTSVEKDGQQRRHSETIREMCLAKGIFVTVATGKV